MGRRWRKMQASVLGSNGRPEYRTAWLLEEQNRMLAQQQQAQPGYPVAAGWFKPAGDPTAPARWWDGFRWTDQLRP